MTKTVLTAMLVLGGLLSAAPRVIAEDVEALIRGLADGKQRHKSKVALTRLIKVHDPGVQAAMPKFVEAYGWHYGQVDWAMMIGLVRLMAENGYELREVMPPLVDSFRTAQGDDRCELMLLFGNIGPSAEAAVPRLQESFHADGTSGAYYRTRAACALARIHPQDAVAIDALIGWLGAEKNVERWLAADALARIGPNAARAGDRLLKSLDDPDPTVRVIAAMALWRISHETDRTMPVLIRALSEEDAPFHVAPRLFGSLVSSQRWVAVATLGGMGPRATDAVPSLVAILKQPARDDEQLIFYQRVVRALAEISPRDPTAVAAFQEIKDAPVTDSRIPTPRGLLRQAAVEALKRSEQGAENRSPG